MRPPTLRRREAGVAVLLGAALAIAPITAVPVLANTAGTGIVISEVYGAGGNSGAALNQDFVELYNPTDADVALTGTSVQYRSATGTANPSGVIPLTGTIAAHGHFLVGAASGTTGAAIPTPDVSSSSVNLSGTTGTVFLAAQSTALSSPPTGSLLGNPAVIDVVGFGTSNSFETAPAPAPSTVLSIQRAASGTDTDSNATDFTAATPTPEAGGVVAPPACASDLSIAEIQGDDDASPCVGLTVTTRGVVTAAYPTGGFNGYYVQTPGTGGAVGAASDAIFVYSPSTVAGVTIGSYVQVTGTVSEFNGLTELSVASAGLTVLPDAAAPITPVTDVPTGADREALEGMLVQPAGDWTITDNYDLNAYGSVGIVAGDAPLVTPTQAVEPGSAAVAYAAQNAAELLTLDDGASINFLGADANKDIPLPYLSAANPTRVGATGTFDVPVVLDYRNGLWNLQPTTQLTANGTAPATFENTRPAGPADVGGDLTLASFNVLNYFPTTGDQLTGCTYYTDRDGDPVTVSGGCLVRGAAEADDLARQQAKIVSAINGLGADVVSLEEIENSVELGQPRDAGVATLVAALNAALGSDVWAYVPSPAVTPASQDVIRTAFIYRKASALPVGASVILDDPAFANARQPLAQVFQKVGGGASDAFLAIVNHFKSKGSGEGANADQGDGQGASNADRVAQAHALIAFEQQMSASTGLDRVFLLGDFNAYLKEDPIDVITAAGFTDLGSTRTQKSTYAFDGAVGSLDHIFASPAALGDVAGVDIWNINAYESVAFEYSRDNYNATDFYAPNQFRASDHDPILVGVALQSAVTAGTPTITGRPGLLGLLTAHAGEWGPEPVTLSYQWLRGSKPIAGATSATYRVRLADVGHRLSVVVTGEKPGFTSATATSDPVRITLLGLSGRAVLSGREAL